MKVSAKTSHYLRRMRKALLWGMGGGALLFVAACLGVYLVCTYKSDMVSALVEGQLNRVTGLRWRLEGGVRPTFLPTPGASFNNVSIYTSPERIKEGVRPLFSAEKLRVEPDIAALFTGRLSIGDVTLISPYLAVIQEEKTDTGQEGRPLPRHGDEAEPKALVEEAKRDAEKAVNGTMPASPLHGDTELTPEDIAAYTKLPANRNFSAFFGGDDTPSAAGPLAVFRKVIQSGTRERLNSFTVENGHVTVVSHEGNPVMALSGVNYDLLTKAGKKSWFEARLEVPVADIVMDIEGFIRVPKDNPDTVLEGAIKGSAVLSPPESRDIPLDFSSSFSWRTADDMVLAPDFRVEGEGDAVVISLAFDAKDVRATGRLAVENLSLPRWFMFARNFPPGLQAPLHALKGDGNFVLTPNGALAHDLLVEAGGLRVKGSVGAADFSLPVVKVDLDLESPDGAPIDLDRVFPFLATSDKEVPEPVEPKFTMPYLVPYPGPAGEELPDVGYDVNVRVPEAVIHSMTGGPLDVKVFPIEDDVTRVVFVSPSLAEGSVAGRLDIDTDIVRMRYDLKDVNLALMPENIGSSVVFAGRATGGTDLTVKVTDGKWSDVWDITFDASADGLKVANPREGWHLTAKKTKATGKGVVHTVRKTGLRLEGVWSADTSGVFTSWNPGGDDKVKGVLKGSLAWPPETSKERGIYHVYGDVDASGVLMAPLASQLVPVRGKLQSPFDWRIDTGLVKLDPFTFDGWQSYITGKLQINAARQPAKIDGEYSFKMSPRVVLADWKLLPDAIKMPEVLTGKGGITSEGPKTAFDNLVMQMDGAAVKGRVHTLTSGNAPAGSEGYRVLVDMDFAANRIDIDKYIAPSTPEELTAKPATTPWDLSFLRGIDVKGKLTMDKGRFRSADFSDTEITARLDKGRLSVVSLTEDVYGGRGTVNLRGVLDPGKSTLDVHKLLAVLKGASLGRAIHDLSGEDVYGGVADMVLDLKGLMRCSADFPGALSGAWSMEVRDGIYPAFLGSETAGLRNTFTIATASGSMEKGVMKCDNFALSGSMVDMKGGGWVDLGGKKLDLGITVALAGVPTAPVKFSGPFSAMEMTVSGTRVAVGAAQVAGVSVFYLFRGILELPARAVRGVGSIFTPGEKVTGTTYQPKRDTTQRPRPQRRPAP